MNASDKKYLFISIAMHIAVIVLLTVKVYFFPNERMDFVRAVRVDLVALPDKDPEEGPHGVEKPPAEAAQTPEPPKKKDEPVKLPTEKPKDKKAKAEKPEKKKPKEETKADEAKDTKATKDQQNDALKRLQALKKLKDKLKANKEGPEGKEYKGNQINDGNSLTGVEKIQYDKYLSDFNDHIKRHWQLPEWLSQKDLSAVVTVRFDESGNIIEKRIARSSGDAAFDREAVQAVVSSAPFPLPPENLISRIKARGIEVRFPE